MKVWDRLLHAISKTKRLFFTPFALSKKTVKNKQVHVKVEEGNTFWKFIFQKFSFNLPDHYPLHKKLQMIKSQSSVGKFWDIFLVTLSIIACIFYVCQTYVATYDAVQVYSVVETLYTQFFAVDFIFNFFSAPDKVQYLMSPWTFVDLITIIPVYITMSAGSSRRINLSVFRFVRILRLVRILQTFKLLGGFSGVKRQIITLSLTLSSLVFMAAGIIQIMENDVKMQLEYKCRYINSRTDYAPSCSPEFPVYMLSTPCDCEAGHCESYFTGDDPRGQPSGIRCISLTFLDAFYFMVVTVATVGYGDIYPTTIPSKIVVIVFIITSLVVIPMQVNKLTTLLSFSSMFRNPYIPSNHSTESHVIICGHVADWRRVERIFREFFHPARFSSSAPEFHVLLLSPVEPSEDLKALLLSPAFDSKVSYLIGSALSIEDLQKARADIASAMLFLCNTEVGSQAAKLDDAATVLRTLSVNNFNPNLECFVQVLCKEDREILKDSEIDVVVCLDELRTTLQARNCICPGLTTIVENLFHSFGTVAYSTEHSAPWLADYEYGCNFEVYYIPLPHMYLAAMAFEWSLIAEGIYLEFDTIALGVCCPVDHSIILNPSNLEMAKYNYPSRFFAKYSVLILLASDQESANFIASGINEHQVINKIISKLLLAEDYFKVRKLAKLGSNVKRSAAGTPHELNLAMKELIRISKSRSQGSNDGTSSATGSKALNSKGKRKDNDRQGDDNDGAAGEDYDGGDAEDDDEEEEGMGSDNYLGYVKPQNLKNKILGYGRKFSSVVHDGLGKIANVNFPHFDSVKESDLEDGDEDEEEDSDAENESDSQSQGRGAGSSFQRRGGTGVDLEFQHSLQALMEAQFRGMDLGHASQELDNANSFKNHIVVFGCLTNLFVFVSELRRPLISSSSYHIIVVIAEETPERWNDITEAFEDCYYIRGKITSSADFNRTNIRDALAVVLLASRDGVTKVEEENLDSDILFSYLKLEKYIPRNVFFTVELTCVSNMAVLNSTAVRRATMGERSTVMIASQKEGPNNGNGNGNMIGASPNSAVPGLGGKLYAPPDSYTMRGAFTSQKKSDLAFHQQQQQNHQHNQKRKFLKFKKLFGNSKKALTKGNPHANGNGHSHGHGQMGRGRGGPGGQSNLSLRHLPHGKGSNKAQGRNTGNKSAESFWTVSDTHHALPVFASGRAYVPLTFDAMLVQSFFSSFTPQLMERFVCGQKFQTMFQIPLPSSFVGKYFVDLYRACLSHQLMIIGLYRAPCEADKSLLPFAYTNPKPETILRRDDKIFVFCNPVELNSAYQSCLGHPIAVMADGTFSLTDLAAANATAAAAANSNNASSSKRAMGSVMSPNFRTSALFSPSGKGGTEDGGGSGLGLGLGLGVGGSSGEVNSGGQQLPETSEPSIPAPPMTTPASPSLLPSLLSSSTKTDAVVILNSRTALNSVKSLDSKRLHAFAVQRAASAFKASGKGTGSPLIGNSPSTKMRKKMG